jgi:hypothetical protein
VPGSWDVQATKGAAELSFTSTVRSVVSCAPRDGGFLATFVLDSRATIRTAGETRQLGGVGRSEYIEWTLNPVEGSAT